MIESKEIRIPLSKSKIVLLILAAIGFVAAGIWLIINPESFYGYPTIFGRTLGVVSILFFGGGGIIGVKKLFQSGDGLIINSAGIIDSTSGASIGLVKKEDIVRIRIQRVASTKFLLVDVSNPQTYIDNAPNAAVKKLLQMNHSMYGTPLSINSAALKIKFDKLEKLLTDYIQSETA